MPPLLSISFLGVEVTRQYLDSLNGQYSHTRLNKSMSTYLSKILHLGQTKLIKHVNKNLPRVVLFLVTIILRDSDIFLETVLLVCVFCDVTRIGYTLHNYYFYPYQINSKQTAKNQVQ